MLDDKNLAKQGFTLIELLIVLFIISIVASVAVLSIGHQQNKRLESFANELTQIMTLAEEQAMLQPAVLGLSFNENAFYFSSLHAAVDDKKEVWTPLNDTILGLHRIPNDIAIGLKISGKYFAEKEDEVVQKMPQIIISTNGDIVPFTIYIGKKGEKPRYAITKDENGNVINQLLS